jgi:lipopolysaccharide transport system permease protein
LALPPLPDQPLVVVEAGARGFIDFKHLWAYRDLLYFLIWRDVKVRYRQTLLGAAWAILQPLLTVAIFTFIFGFVAKIDSNGIPYPLFAYSALLPWTFFANALTQSGNSVVNSSHLITKVYFPRLIIPIASVCSGLVDLAVAFPVLFGLLLYYRLPLRLTILTLVPLVLLTTFLATAVGIWLSAMNVKYRDIKVVIPFLIQIWMYMSPIAYPITAIPAKWRMIYSLNPFVGIAEAYRASIFGGSFDWTALAVSLVLMIVILLVAVHQFRRMEREFADVV